jgi:diguanylate cyclase (GGDEF)-like protein
VGGDEFVLLLPELGLIEEAEEVARRTLEMIRQPIILEGMQLQMTASIGIALWERGETHVESLLKRADAAMYQVKKSGKNAYGLYHRESGEDCVHVQAADDPANGSSPAE